MKWLRFIIYPLIFFQCVSVFAETEQPVYEVEDRAVSENFRNMSYTIDQHKHSGTDGSSKMYDVIPDTGSVYALGAPLTRWATVYTDRIEFSDGTRQTTASGSSISTFTFNLRSGGDVLLATTPFVAIPGMFFDTGKSTWNATYIRAKTVDVSTVGSTFFQVARTTGADARSAAQFTYMTHHVVVTTNSTESTWDSGTWTFFSTETYSVHITSIPQNGQLPANFQFSIQYWR